MVPPGMCGSRDSSPAVDATPAERANEGPRSLAANCRDQALYTEDISMSCELFLASLITSDRSLSSAVAKIAPPEGVVTLDSVLARASVVSLCSALLLTTS